MKKMKKLLALLMVSLMVIGSLAACGSNNNNTPTDGGNQTATDAPKATDAPAATDAPTEPDTSAEPEKITLKVWGSQEDQNDENGKMLQTMCENFNALHPEWDITFEYAVCGVDVAKDEALKDPEAAADVFAFAGDQIGELVQAEILMPITKGVEDIASHLPQPGLDAAEYDGYYYALPFTPNTWFMYYDKSKYTEDEVKNLNTMMEKDLGDGVYNVALETSAWYTCSFFFATGCTLFGDDGQDPTICDFNSENGLKAGTYAMELYQNPKSTKSENDNVVSLFQEGKLGACFSGTWKAGDFSNALGDNYAATCLPQITIDGTDYQLQSLGDYKYMGVNLNTDYPEAAQALVLYLLGEECQLLRYQSVGSAPTYDTLANDPAITSDIAVSAQTSQLPYVHIQSSIPAMGNIWTPVEAFFTQCYSKEINSSNIQENLDKMNAQMLGTVAE